MSANFFAMFNENVDGAAIHSGAGPCAVGGLTCPSSKLPSYTSKGIRDKPVFFYSGINDTVVKHAAVEITSLWFKLKGADVKHEWYHEFKHIFPQAVPSNEHNPVLSCAEREEEKSTAA